MIEQLNKLCDPVEIGKRLQILMIQRGVSPTELASRIEANITMIASYRLGKVTMRLNKAVQISAALGVSLDEFLTGKSNGVWQAPTQEINNSQP